MVELRSLVIVLGDQLNLDATAFDDFDATQDAVWMAEVLEESTHVWSSKQRSAIFLSAMRHFAQALTEAGLPLHYTPLQVSDTDESGRASTLAAELRRAIDRLKPQRLLLTAPGDWRVLRALKRVAKDSQVPLDIREDRHFYVSVREFSAYVKKPGDSGSNTSTAICVADTAS